MSANTIQTPPAVELRPGARIVIGRYRVQVVTAPQGLTVRPNLPAEVALVVRDLDDGALWGVSVGAEQRFPLVQDDPS